MKTSPVASRPRPAKSEDWPPARVIHITRTRCPRCTRASLLTQHSTTIADEDTTIRKTLCRTCGWRFEVIVS
jgi:hypothetical protein